MSDRRLLPDGIELKPFTPAYAYFSGIGMLVYFSEDCSYLTVPVVRGEYHTWDLLRHGYENRFIGFQIWLAYNPHLLLADQRQ